MRVRESDAACLVVSAAMHSGRGHFLYAMTPATPALLTWSGLPDQEEAVFAVGTGPLRGNTGVGGGFLLGGFLEKSGQKLCRMLRLSLHARLV